MKVLLLCFFCLVVVSTENLKNTYLPPSIIQGTPKFEPLGNVPSNFAQEFRTGSSNSGVVSGVTSNDFSSSYSDAFSPFQNATFENDLPRQNLDKNKVKPEEGNLISAPKSNNIQTNLEEQLPGLTGANFLNNNFSQVQTSQFNEEDLSKERESQRFNFPVVANGRFLADNISNLDSRKSFLQQTIEENPTTFDTNMTPSYKNDQEYIQKAAPNQILRYENMNNGDGSYRFDINGHANVAPEFRTGSSNGGEVSGVTSDDFSSSYSDAFSPSQNATFENDFPRQNLDENKVKPEEGNLIPAPKSNNIQTNLEEQLPGLTGANFLNNNFSQVQTSQSNEEDLSKERESQRFNLPVVANGRFLEDNISNLDSRKSFLKQTNEENPTTVNTNMTPHYKNDQDYIQKAASIQILRYENVNNGDGSYRFEYETENQIIHEESGHLKNVGTPEEAMMVKGFYSYVAPNGQKVTVNYIADENGFQPAGEHLPILPSIIKSLQSNIDTNRNTEDNTNEQINDKKNYLKGFESPSDGKEFSDNPSKEDINSQNNGEDSINTHKFHRDQKDENVENSANSRKPLPDVLGGYQNFANFYQNENGANMKNMKKSHDVQENAREQNGFQFHEDHSGANTEGDQNLRKQLSETLGGYQNFANDYQNQNVAKLENMRDSYDVQENSREQNGFQFHEDHSGENTEDDQNLRKQLSESLGGYQNFANDYQNQNGAKLENMRESYDVQDNSREQNGFQSQEFESQPSVYTNKLGEDTKNGPKTGYQFETVGYEENQNSPNQNSEGFNNNNNNYQQNGYYYK